MSVGRGSPEGLYIYLACGPEAWRKAKGSPPAFDCQCPINKKTTKPA